MKVTVPFEKKIKEIKHKRIVGADAGITDLLYSSDGKAYGTFTRMSAFYEKVVESKTGQRAKLRSVMRKHQNELKSCTREAQKEVLRKKIHHIASQLNQTNNLNKCRRKYAHEVDVRLNQVVKSFMRISKDNLYLFRWKVWILTSSTEERNLINVIVLGYGGNF